MHNISSLPAASRATTLTYRTHSHPSNRSTWRISRKQVGDPPYLRNLTRFRMVLVHLSKNQMCSEVPLEPICRKAIGTSPGPHFRRRFRLRGAVVLPYTPPDLVRTLLAM